MVLRGVSPLGASLKRARADYENIARGPFGQWDPPLDRDRYHIAGDETGIPAAVQVIQAMEESSARSPCSRQRGMSGWRLSWA